MASSQIKNITVLMTMFVAAIFLSACQKNIVHTVRTDFADHQIIPIVVNGTQHRVEVVNTAESITQGLSDRDHIGSDGMLFFLHEQRIPTFWMKRMHFPLDLIWINRNHIVDVTRNVPAPNSAIPESDLPLYSPTTSSNMVLEVPAGMSEKWHIRKGDALEIQQ